MKNVILLLCLMVVLLSGCQKAKPAAEQKPEEIVLVDGFELVKDEFEAITNDQIVFRKGPDQSSAVMAVDYFHSQPVTNDDSLPINYFVPSMKFSVLGHSKEKSTVEEVENYWYYVSYNDGTNEPTFGWVFGKFLEPYDATLYEQYFAKDTYQLISEPHYLGPVETISKAYLSATIWSYFIQDIYSYISLGFTENDEFGIEIFQGGIYVRGKYEILEGNKVRLYDYAFKDGYRNELEIKMRDAFLSEKECILNFKVDATNFWRVDQLYGAQSNVFFGADGSEPPVDLSYSLNGIDLVKETWQAVTNERVKFRKEPSKSAETYLIDLPADFDSSLQIDYFLKGIDFNVLGRIKDKVNVGGIVNYWYYIAYTSLEFPQTGWVFGEYIEPYQPDKAEEYDAILREEITAVE